MRILQRLEDLFLLSLVTGLVVSTCGQILLRNFFGLTIPGTESFVRHLVLWIGMAGALAATRSDKHIRIDAVLRFLPAIYRRFVLATADLFTASLCTLLTIIAWRFIEDEREFGALAFFDVPAWIAQLCFPLAFGLMTLRFLHLARGRLRDRNS